MMTTSIRYPRALRFFIGAFIVASLLGSCASPPPDTRTPSAPRVSARLLPKDALKQAFGSKVGENPFIEPVGMVLGQPNEFAIVEVLVDLPVKGRISFSASLEAEGIGDAGLLKLRDDFTEYWASFEGIAGASLRDSKIAAVCPYAASFETSKGRHRYYLVFVGKNPMPRPATAYVQVLVTGDKIQAFEFPLPPPVVSKGLFK